MKQDKQITEIRGFSDPLKQILILVSNRIQLKPGSDADTTTRRLESLPNLYTVPLEDGLKRKSKTCNAEVNKEINKRTLCITLVIIQLHFKMHGPYNIKQKIF
jgi:hypothetical protein